MLSEAYGTRRGHISCASAQPVLLEPLQGLNIRRAWILPIGQCHPYHCKCCVIGLTCEGALYSCPFPSNQQRWVHNGAVLIKGLEGKSLLINFTSSQKETI